MFDGISPQLLFGQLLLGLINGSFYAMLSMGLAIIFGLMNVVNFAHGAQYMLGGAFAIFHHTPDSLGRHEGCGHWRMRRCVGCFCGYKCIVTHLCD